MLTAAQHLGRMGEFITKLRGEMVTVAKAAGVSNFRYGLVALLQLPARFQKTKPV
jgi:hypothetical protein